MGVVIPEHNRTGRTSSKGTVVTAQCFPLYSILLAVHGFKKRIDVDFFSLDIEGHELMILKTIPFHRVNIKVRTISNFSTYEKELGSYIMVSMLNFFPRCYI